MLLIVLICVWIHLSAGAECSTECSQEFTDRCISFPGHGFTGVAAYNHCRARVDDVNIDSRLRQKCIVGCTSTPAMLEAAIGTDNQPAPTPPPTSEFPRATATSPTGQASAIFGVVVIVGDSAVDGTGTTQGEFEKAIAAGLQTTVINNAIGGSTVATIYKHQPACSSMEDCKWSIIVGGMNAGDGRSDAPTMQMLVDREVSYGKRVIIHGHRFPKKENKQDHYVTFMANHFAIAAGNANVWFLDPMNNTNLGSASEFYASDGSHPSPLAGKIMGESIAELIKVIELESDTSIAPSPTPAQDSSRAPTPAAFAKNSFTSAGDSFLNSSRSNNKFLLYLLCMVWIGLFL